MGKVKELLERRKRSLASHTWTLQVWWKPRWRLEAKDGEESTELARLGPSGAWTWSEEALK
eukprot:1856261-Lingulodinium_polyedra.AAC.1